MDQQKIRIAIGIFSAISFAIILFFIDYSDLSWSKNKGPYSVLIFYAFLATAMVGSFHHAESQKEESENRER